MTLEDINERLAFIKESIPETYAYFESGKTDIESIEDVVTRCDYTNTLMLSGATYRVVYKLLHRGLEFRNCHPDHVDDYAFFCECSDRFYDKTKFDYVFVEGRCVCYDRYSDSLYLWDSDDCYHWVEEPDDYGPLGLAAYGEGYSSVVKSGEALSIELEVKVGVIEPTFRDEIRAAGADDAEKDSSLHPTHGAEVIFGSTLLADIPKKTEKICRVLKKFECTGHDASLGTTQYGMHVSVSKRGWDISIATLARMILLIDNNREFFEGVAQRESNNWASYRKRNANGAMVKIAERNKYEAIAIRSDDRIEFRMFRSNTRYERILKNCEVVVSVIKYCKSVINHNSVSIKDYACFVRDNVKHYPNLNIFLFNSFLFDTLKTNINKL
jgi:hypothetical protein